MTIVLYELQPTRSARVRWTLLELGIPFESIEGREVFAMPELAQIHPMSKLPALRDNGRPLFESAAICTWLADSHPRGGSHRTLRHLGAGPARPVDSLHPGRSGGQSLAYRAQSSSSTRRKSASRRSMNRTRGRQSAAWPSSTAP